MGRRWWRWPVRDGGGCAVCCSLFAPAACRWRCWRLPLPSLLWAELMLPSGQTFGREKFLFVQFTGPRASVVKRGRHVSQARLVEEAMGGAHLDIVFHERDDMTGRPQPRPRAGSCASRSARARCVFICFLCSFVLRRPRVRGVLILYFLLSFCLSVFNAPGVPPGVGSHYGACRDAARWCRRGRQR